MGNHVHGRVRPGQKVHAPCRAFSSGDRIGTSMRHAHRGQPQRLDAYRQARPGRKREPGARIAGRQADAGMARAPRGGCRGRFQLGPGPDEGKPVQRGARGRVSVSSARMRRRSGHERRKAGIRSGIRRGRIRVRRHPVQRRSGVGDVPQRRGRILRHVLPGDQGPIRRSRLRPRRHSRRNPVVNT